MQELARPEGVDVAGSKTTDFMLESVRALDSQAFSRWFFFEGSVQRKMAALHFLSLQAASIGAARHGCHE